MNYLIASQHVRKGAIPPTIGTLTGINLGIDTAYLTWDPAIGTVAGYKIYQNGSLVATVGNQTNWYTTSLSSTTYYSFYIKAFNSAGDSSASNTMSGYTSDYGYPTINSFTYSQTASGIQCNWNVSIGFGSSRTYYVEVYHKPSGTGTWLHQNGNYQIIWPATSGSLTLTFSASYQPIAHGVTYDLWLHVVDYPSGYAANAYGSITTT